MENDFKNGKMGKWKGGGFFTYMQLKCQNSWENIQVNVIKLQVLCLKYSKGGT